MRLSVSSLCILQGALPSTPPAQSEELSGHLQSATSALGGPESLGPPKARHRAWARDTEQQEVIMSLQSVFIFETRNFFFIVVFKTFCIN